MSSGKDDFGKPDFTLVSPEIIKAVQRIRELGSKKYGSPDNWKTVENGKMRFWKAALRHVVEAWDDPGAIDPESGYRHIDHIACNLNFIMEYLKSESAEIKTADVSNRSTVSAKKSGSAKSTGAVDHRKRAKASDIDTGKIRALHKAGWTAKNIAGDMGLSINTVYRVLNGGGKYGENGGNTPEKETGDNSVHIHEGAAGGA